MNDRAPLCSVVSATRCIISVLLHQISEAECVITGYITAIDAALQSQSFWAVAWRLNKSTILQHWKRRKLDLNFLKCWRLLSPKVLLVSRQTLIQETNYERSSLTRHIVCLFHIYISDSSSDPHFHLFDRNQVPYLWHGRCHFELWMKSVGLYLCIPVRRCLVNLPHHDLFLWLFNQQWKISPQFSENGQSKRLNSAQLGRFCITSSW